MTYVVPVNFSYFLLKGWQKILPDVVGIVEKWSSGGSDEIDADESI